MVFFVTGRPLPQEDWFVSFWLWVCCEREKFMKRAQDHAHWQTFALAVMNLQFWYRTGCYIFMWNASFFLQWDSVSTGLDDRCWIPGMGTNFFLFTITFRPTLAATQFVFSNYRCPFPGGKRPGREADLSSPSSSEVKNLWICTSKLPIRLHGVGLSLPNYEGEQYLNVSKSFRTDRLERELQIVRLSATRCSCIAITWVNLVSFAAITLYVASERVILKVSVYFVIDSFRKLLDSHTDSFHNCCSSMQLHGNSIKLKQGWEYVIRTCTKNNEKHRVEIRECCNFSSHPC
jgi:hypothetical protein